VPRARLPLRERQILAMVWWLASGWATQWR
jgi:hypothetical protein